MVFTLVAIAIGFFCAGYEWGHEKAFKQKLIHMEKVIDDLIKENSELRKRK